MRKKVGMIVDQSSCKLQRPNLKDNLFTFKYEKIYDYF